MTDRDFDNYLALLFGMLRLRRTQRDQIAGELRDHLIEHVAHLETSGISHEEAVRRALEEFGDAAALAAGFSALVGMRRRRLIMRCTIGTTVVMTGLVLAMLAFRPPVIDDPSIAQAQPGAGSGQPARKGVAGEGGSAPIGRGQMGRPMDPDAATRAKLKSDSSAEFGEVPLTDLLDHFTEKHGIQYYLDKRSLEAANVAPDVHISLNLKNVPAEMILDLVLRQAGLDYRLRSGVIMVASKQTIQSQVEVRVYPVPEEDAAELAKLIPATIATDNWRELFQFRTVYGAMPGAGMPQDMAGGPGMAGTPAGTLDSMALTGGGPGTIRVFRGVLVISQTPEVHERIRNLIDALDSVLADRPRRPAAMMDPRGAAAPAGGEGSADYPAPNYGADGGSSLGAPLGYGGGDASRGYGAREGAPGYGSASHGPGSRARYGQPRSGPTSSGPTAPSPVPSLTPGGSPSAGPSVPAGAPPGPGAPGVVPGAPDIGPTAPQAPGASPGAPTAPETPRTGAGPPSAGAPGGAPADPAAPTDDLPPPRGALPKN